MLLPKTTPAAIPGGHQESTTGGKGGRSAGRGPRQSPGQDVGLLGTARGTLQHLRLPRLAASRWTGRLLPKQSLQSAGRLLLGKSERGASQRRTLGVRGVLGSTLAARSLRRRLIQPECELLLGMIQALYDVETRPRRLTWQDRQALAVALSPRSFWTPSGNGGIARAAGSGVTEERLSPRRLRYLRNHWQALKTCMCVTAASPIDNNAVERLMKQVAMGRKAWLFVCNVAGGEQSVGEDDDLGEQACQDGMTSTCGSTSRTCWTSCWRARRTTTACCLTSGSRRTRRLSASTASRSDGTKPSVSNSTRPAAASSPATGDSIAPRHRPRPHAMWCCCTLSECSQWSECSESSDRCAYSAPHVKHEKLRRRDKVPILLQAPRCARAEQLAHDQPQVACRNLYQIALRDW